MSWDVAQPEGAAVADDPARAVRRIVLVAAVAVVAAAVAGLLLSLRGGSPRARLLPETFQQRGFVDRAVHLVDEGSVPAGERSGVVTFAVHQRGPWYVVARCDTGVITIDVGGASSTATCDPVGNGVVVLAALPRRVEVRVRVTRPQSRPWSVGLYR